MTALAYLVWWLRGKYRDWLDWLVNGWVDEMGTTDEAIGVRT